MVDGNVSFTPAAIKADTPEDEVSTVTMEDGKKYRVHTVNELLPGMDITGTGVKASDAGVYTFALDHFFLRVNTDGELVYYRYIPQYEVTVDDRSGDAENMAENFAAQDAVDGSRYYTGAASPGPSQSLRPSSRASVKTSISCARITVWTRCSGRTSAFSTSCMNGRMAVRWDRACTAPT